MKILTRYILREFCIPLFYCLMGFISIYVLFELFGSFNKLMAAKPGLSVTATYFAGYFAPYFQWMAPACLMLATLYTMWRFCRNSEVIAMRASGIGFFTIVKPILAVAVLIACAVAWVNESYMPEYSSWAKRFKDARFNSEKMTESNRVLYVNGERTWQADMPRARRANPARSSSLTTRRVLRWRRMTFLKTPDLSSSPNSTSSREQCCWRTTIGRICPLAIASTTLRRIRILRRPPASATSTRLTHSLSPRSRAW